MSLRIVITGVLAALSLSLSSCGQRGVPSATPTLKYVKEKEGGCANFFLYKGTANELEVLWISAHEKEREKLPGKGSKTYDLSASLANIQVGIDLWDSPGFYLYCTDVTTDLKKKATWVAKKGKLTITTSEPNPADPGPEKRFTASARLEGVVFEDGAGNQAKLEAEAITDVRVGWYPG